MQIIPPCFHDGDCIVVFPLYNGFQLVLFVAHPACTGVDAIQLGYWFWQLWGGGEILIPTWPFSDASMVSNVPITFASLLPHGSSSLTSTETGDQRTLLAHHSSNTGILIPGLSTENLVLSLSLFTCSLKLFQWALLTLCKQWSPERYLQHLFAFDEY